jgi:hypothetical protein
MQAPIKVDAHSLERIVRIPPINGSMAAFASWNSRMHPANASKRRSARTLRTGAATAPASVSPFAVTRTDTGERQQRGCEGCGKEEHRLVRQASACSITAADAADRGEAGIAAEPRLSAACPTRLRLIAAMTGLSTQLAPMQDARPGPPRRSAKRERERSRQIAAGERGDEPRRAHGVDQRRRAVTASNQSARSQHQADIELR